MIYLFNEYGNQMITTEVFAGTKPEFKEIEKNLKVIIDAANNNSLGINKGVGTIPEISKVEQLIIKAFGYAGLSLFITDSISLTGSVPNAYTWPESMKYTKYENLKRMNWKNRFTAEGMNECLYPDVTVDANIIRWAGLNEKELFAIILHELGHVSQISLVDMLNAIFLISMNMLGENKIKAVIDTIMSMIIQIPGVSYTISKTVLKPLNEFILSIPGLSDAVKFGRQIVGSVEIISGAMISFSSLMIAISRPGDFIRIMSRTAISDPTWYAGYNVEKIADSFAAKYGYGPALASALQKTSAMKKNPAIKLLDQSIIGRIITDYMMGFNRIIIQGLVTHPANITRATAQLDNLKKDLNDPNLPPKLKKELLSNIDEMERVIKSDYLDFNGDVNKGRSLSTLYNIFMYNAFGGKSDLRDLIVPDMHL